MIYKIFSFILISSLFLFLAGCSSANDNKVPLVSENSAQTNSTPASANEVSEAEKSANSVSKTNNKIDCANLKKAGFALDKKQTFPIDFAPFENSCFAVFHDPEFTNPALGSQFFIYKDGKEVFEFPEQFNGGNATCWVDAVAFEDINKDALKDILVVGKCGAKSGSYNENMAYINTGESFKVNKDANMEMMDFSKISQMKDFIEKNQESFAK